MKIWDVIPPSLSQVSPQPRHTRQQRTNVWRKAASPARGAKRLRSVTDNSSNRRKRTSMRSLLLATTAALMLTGSASAQIVRDGWTFAVLTIWQSRGLNEEVVSRTDRFVPDSRFIVRSSVKREPYGVFTSQDDCDIARAKKIDELDRGNYRLPHSTANAPVITNTITMGATSITSTRSGGPTETMHVTECAAL
jgi:hypothetical protein